MGKAPFSSCIFILADGARPDVLEVLLDAGDLPSISRYIVEPGAYRRGITVFPSTTGPAYIPFVTGCFPGPANIPGIRWFDRGPFTRFGVWSRNSYRSYVGPASYEMNRDLRADRPTLFELFERPANIFNAINRGVGFWGNTTKVIRGFYWLYAHWTDRWDRVDRAAERLLHAAIARQSNFIFVVFPGVDEYAHITHPFSEEVLDAYRRVDRALGEIARHLHALGRLEQTLFVLTSDHGLTRTDVHFDPGDYLDDLGYRTLHFPKIFRPDADAAYMVSGNGMGHVYFKTHPTWDRPAFYEDLRNTRVDPVSRFLAREEIDLVIGRSRNGDIRVANDRGEARIIQAQGRYTYKKITGDPLDYGDLPKNLTDRDVLRLTYHTRYPDAPVQIAQLFSSPRTGDLLLSARKGYDLRSSEYENPDHRASHGSLHREHMQVPLALNHPVATNWIRTADVFPSILRLTGRPVPEKIDGQPFVTL